MVRDTSERMGNPTVAVTLTSVDPDRPLGKEWSRDVEHVTRAVRRRHPETQYLGFMEWTTGKARHAGGRRRPHQHFLMRGIPRNEAAATESVVREVWEARTGANRVEVAPLRSNEAGIAYLALHHRKENQAPPESFTGRRLRASKGWWGMDAHELRKSARERLQQRATRHKLVQELRLELAIQGLEIEDLDLETYDVLLTQKAATVEAPEVRILRRA